MKKGDIVYWIGDKTGLTLYEIIMENTDTNVKIKKIGASNKFYADLVKLGLFWLQNGTTLNYKGITRTVARFVSKESVLFTDGSDAKIEDLKNCEII